MKDKEKVKRIAIYALSVVLLVVFVIIPWWYITRPTPPSICRSICPNGEVEGATDENYCICSDGTIINPDSFNVKNNNESE